MTVQMVIETLHFNYCPTRVHVQEIFLQQPHRESIPRLMILKLGIHVRYLPYSRMWTSWCPPTILVL